jgi:hypothetical protein
VCISVAKLTWVDQDVVLEERKRSSALVSSSLEGVVGYIHNLSRLTLPPGVDLCSSGLCVTGGEVDVRMD